MMEPMQDEEMMAEDMPMEEPMAEESPVEGELSADEEAVASQMEQMMGNYLDMPDEDRKRAQTIVMGPVADIVDQIVGQPMLTRLREQLATSMGAAEEAAPAEEMPTEEPAGIMAEAPAEEMPMEDEEEII